ncbi:synaptic vesicle glycoprotein 2B-like [Glandiceps talaboti]
MAEGGEEFRLVSKAAPPEAFYTYEADNDSEVEVDLGDLILERRYQNPDPEANASSTQRPIQNAAVRKEEKIEEQINREIDLANAYETAISEAGYGLYQVKLLFILGLGLMADGVEIFSMGYVIPSAERDLCLNDVQKGWLGGIVFLGMLVGAILWGNLSDRIGRRDILITCLVVNAAFAFGSSFVASFEIFLICRLGAGLGIGGSIPICVCYYGEFIPKDKRGCHLSWLQMFYVCGGLFAAAAGLAIIPALSPQVEEPLEDRFHPWRIFILVCSLPCVFAVVFLCFMTESPRYLLQNGKWQEAVKVLAEVYSENHKGVGVDAYKRNCTEIYKFSTKVKSMDANAKGTFLQNCCGKCCEMFDMFMGIFQEPLTWTTIMLIVCFSCTAFGVYGLTLWFPEYIKRLEMINFFKRTEIISNITIYNTTFDGKIVNKGFVNVTFRDVTFEGTTFQHVNFTGAEFIDVTFKDTIKTSGTYFHHSEFYNTTFNHTDLYHYRFIESKIDPTTKFINTVEGCQLDFSYAYDPKNVYLEVFAATWAGVPGVIISALLMDRVGAKLIYVTSVSLSAVSVFFIWLVDTESAAVAMLAVVQFFGQAQWNSLDVMIVVLYPTDKRTSAFGFLTALGRIGGVLGNVTFGRYLSVSRAIPILTVAVMFVLGGLSSIKLPNTRGVALM